MMSERKWQQTDRETEIQEGGREGGNEEREKRKPKKLLLEGKRVGLEISFSDLAVSSA